jgi:hypothetical protein
VWERGSANWILQAGQYTITPDHRPLLGPTPVEGLYVNTGYSGHGVMGSAAGGRIVVDTLTGRLSPDQNPLRPIREFQHREIDRLWKHPCSFPVIWSVSVSSVSGFPVASTLTISSVDRER